MVNKIKVAFSYKQLSVEQERGLILWLNYLEESTQNAYIQISRWNKEYRGWDFEMFLIATVGIYDSATVLNSIPSSDAEFKKILQRFKKEFEYYNLKHWRDNFLHREKIFKNQDRKSKNLPDRPVWILGAYNFSTDEYIFDPYIIKVANIFLLVRNFRKRMRALIRKRRTKAYLDKINSSIQGMIPYTHFHTIFAENRKNKKNAIKKYLKSNH
jgi:hypothetical protein